jgi:Tfp pilus assembly protein FimT
MCKLETLRISNCIEQIKLQQFYVIRDDLTQKKKVDNNACFCHLRVVTNSISETSTTKQFKPAKFDHTTHEFYNYTR